MYIEVTEPIMIDGKPQAIIDYKDGSIWVFNEETKRYEKQDDKSNN